MAETNLEQLKRVLDELFMFDRADLDFGLYRIMNVRREEIRRFLDRDLLPKVREALGEMAAGDRAATEAALHEAMEQARALGFDDPSTAPKVRELQAKYDATPDSAAVEAEVYGHLASFFRRYYREGDFISLRRYKEGVYAIPYEGEEVKLHWANADQYYIKSTEQFRDYTFLLPADLQGGERRVHFKLVEADTERNNNRAQAGQDRRFILVDDAPVAEQDGELVVRFEYRADAASRKQKELNEAAEAAVLGDARAAAWASALSKPARDDATSTLLRKHINAYTAKNTFDYFIHKDLGGFLRRELDFYLKNEVMHLDDIDTDGATGALVEATLRKLRAVRGVARPIIEFLASLEEFQKRLWLKKKFVVETHWCVTLDRVPPELYPEIVANDAQREEWVRLFAIDEITSDMVTPTYSAPLTEAFIEANPYLVLDTSFFPRDFAERLLAGVDNLDEMTDGLLIHGENFQALNVLQQRYGGEVGAIYIDPPYNTGGDGFAYKDEYQHSSWLTMFSERLTAARGLCRAASAVAISVDDGEYARLALAATDVIGSHRHLSTIVWQKKDTPANDSSGISTTHDYLLILPVDDGFERHLLPRTESQTSNFQNPDNDARGPWTRSAMTVKNFTKGNNEPLKSPSGKMVAPPAGTGWNTAPEKIRELDEDGRLWWGSKGDGVPFRKTFLSEIQAGVVPVTWWDYRSAGTNRNATAEMRGLFTGEPPFQAPKPVRLIERLLHVIGGGLVLDYFAGSGTTAQAVINLNREDEGQRKYILVEMGEYFDTVLKPRVLKAVYSKDWRDGKPVSREGVSQFVKVIRLESYEDTLNNLRVRRTEQQTSMLESADDRLREQYALRYWISAETQGSPSLLDISAFDDPWSYTLDVGQGSAAETRPVAVDLVETFNYLVGLRVKHVDRIKGVTLVEGTLPASPGRPSGEKAIIIWRNTKEMDAEALDQFLADLRISSRDLEFDVIYVNGDNHLENMRRSDETWKVRLIEDEFQRLMFETADQEQR